MKSPLQLEQLINDVIENTSGYNVWTYWLRFTGLLCCAVLAIAAAIFSIRKAIFPDIAPTEGYFFLLILALAAIFLTRSPFRRAGVTENRIINDFTSLLLASLAILLWVASYFFEINSLLVHLLLLILIIATPFVFLDTSIFGKTTIWFVLIYLGWHIELWVIGVEAHQDFLKLLDIQIHEMFSDKGVYGVAFSAVMDMALIFIFFSAATRLIGINNFFHYFTFRITHGRRFGFSSALYAICASAFYGAISGSARGNITETARHTMPLMRNAGYPSAFAASIEAIASNAGQFIPPIMGVTAYIMIKEYGVSYDEIVLAAIIPALLLIFSLFIAVVVESTKLNLRPINLNDKREFLGSKLQSDDKFFNIKSAKNSFLLMLVALVVFFILIINWDVDISLSILIATAILLVGKLRQKPKLLEYFKFIVNCGKDGLYIIIAATVTGIMLFILTETGVLGFLQDSFTKSSHVLSELKGYHLSLVVVVFCAAIPFFMSMFFPTVATFLVSATLTLPLLTAMGFSQLHSLLFIFYYSSFAGITPPLCPLLDEAARTTERSLVTKNKRAELEKNIKHLISIALVLPIFWIYHPQLLFSDFNVLSWFDDIELLYLIFNFIIAIIAFSAGIFGLKTYNKEQNKEYLLVREYRLSIMLIGFICLFPHFYFKITGIGFILAFFIYYDLKLSPSSLLTPTWALLKTLINPKRMPTPLLLTLLILTFVYTTYITASGFSKYFHDTSVQPWLENRFHIVLSTDTCQLADSTSASAVLDDFLNAHGYPSQTACLQYAPVSLAEVNWGDVIISNMQAVEYQPALTALLPELNPSLSANYAKDVEGYLGSCLAGLEITEINTVKAPASCAYASSLEATLPIIYVGKEIAEIYGLKAGMAISLHSSTFAEDIPQRLNSPVAHQYMIGSIFETGFATDIDRLLILPTDAFKQIYSPYDEGQENKLVIKVKNLEDFRTITDIVALLEDETKNAPLTEKLFYYVDYSIDDGQKTGELQSGLNALDAVFLIISLVALIVLLAVLMQVMDGKRKLLALLRITGIKNEIIWTFVLLLSFGAAIIPYLLAIPLSLVLAGLASLLLDNLAYQTDWKAFYQLLAVVLLFISIATVFLKSYYFSKPISQELANASRYS